MNLEVYKITNKQNGKIYIGITSQGVAARWSKHCSDARRDSTFLLSKAIRKYGQENFQVELIETLDSGCDYDYLKEREIYWIKEYDSYNKDKGYNLTLGGQGTVGRFASDETKNKIRQKALGRVRSIDSRNKQSISIKENNIFDHNEMSKRAVLGNIKRWSDPSNKIKQSVNNPRNKVIVQCSLNNKHIKEFYSVCEAARSINKQHGNIASCARGKLKSAYGFIWKYKDLINEEI